LGVLEAVEAANDRQKHVLVDKVVARFGADLTGRCFALWGLAFKPNTDDMRDAPSAWWWPKLSRRGARIQAYDPVAMSRGAARAGQHPGAELRRPPAPRLQGADALLVVTEWKEFRNPDFDAIKATLKQPEILTAATCTTRR
jgi:UDPglucose 6-dehydrogenase